MPLGYETSTTSKESRLVITVDDIQGDMNRPCFPAFRILRLEQIGTAKTGLINNNAEGKLKASNAELKLSHHPIVRPAQDFVNGGRQLKQENLIKYAYKQKGLEVVKIVMTASRGADSQNIRITNINVIPPPK